MDKYRDRAEKTLRVCRNCKDKFEFSNGAQKNCQPCIDTHGVQRLKDVWTKYGLTCSEVEEMYNHQNGKCPICNKGVELWTGGDMMDKAVIDHCHTTGKVRGLLCQHCNRGIGLFFDMPYALRNAANYLEDNNG